MYGELEESEYDRPGEIDDDIKIMVRLMTIREKIGQMTQLNQDLILTKDGELNTTAVEYYAKNYHVGSYLNQLSSNGVNYNHTAYASILNNIQQISLSVSNDTFKIPIIYGLDHIHGAHYIANSTLFPQGINMAATFNPQLVYEAASITAMETRAAGVHWTFAPVLDIPMNKQWPRVFENFGEDPYLSSVLGKAAIHGYQGKYKTDRSKVAACMKHFIAYGDPWSGQDRDSTVISDRTIYDYLVPNFQTAIDSGVATAMEAYIDINGEPVVASSKYLQQLLRDEMKFKGMLVTDWAEIQHLYTTHKVASSHKEAVRLAIHSTSIDMSMVPSDTTFFDSLVALVEEGLISEQRIDESAERLLQLKKDLGLLDVDNEGWKVESTLLQQVVDSEQKNGRQQTSIDAARQSITLLKNNDNILPFNNNNNNGNNNNGNSSNSQPIKSILVIGPSANDLSHPSGAWTIQWQGATVDRWHGSVEDDQFYSQGVTILEGIRQSASPDIQVRYIEGFDIDGNNTSMDEVLDVIKDYDVVVAAIGEHVYTEVPGNIHDTRLPAGQIKSIEMIAESGKPIVTILVEGRPRILESIVDHSSAILQAYLPGPWGGQAIGEILFGLVNPSGRLPYTYPKHAGDLMLNYWHPVNDVWDPLYEFGHGLSYSKFAYGNISIVNKTDNGDNGIISQGDVKYPILSATQPRTITIPVTNQGPFDGYETVMMYIQQPYRRLTPPAKLLKGFHKVFLESGSTHIVKFDVTADMFAYTGIDNIPHGTIDPGLVHVLVHDRKLELQLLD
ncbi:glycoside hydrolase family 3 domain protein [Halteromyces radiatus]|uniref:glycoside hydrolase family 3 domain protein n=1 Tax=Halteromyces radiatus TaxID=101107 RepID=UPI002220381F|nr:glycoside hydrolase family 3 domain protein [Halteromyces radiatus]KAI8081783.1 glycoside hydrolase family 3 domain protein [Halteromyces radiatus]